MPVLLWATLNSLRKENKKGGKEGKEIRRRTRGLAWKGTQREGDKRGLEYDPDV